MRTSKFTPEQMVLALRQAEGGTPIEEVCRKLGVSEATFHRWKKRFGTLGVPEVREPRQLREENRRLKSVVADLTLDRTILQEAIQKNGEDVPAPAAGWVSSPATSSPSGGLVAWPGSARPRSAIGV